jgi:hypothetical protein
MPSRNSAAFDPLTILSNLRDVEYMVVGGFAAVLYGAPTITADLDIMPSAHEENIARLAAVLVTLHTVVREPQSTGRRLEATVELLKQTAAQASFGGQLRTRTRLAHSISCGACTTDAATVISSAARAC